MESEEVEILSANGVITALRKLEGHALYSIVAVDLATGLRPGELLALAWANVNFAGPTLEVARPLEQTKRGLRFKPPKTKRGRRTISLPPHAVRVLREHRRRQFELRVQMGLGKPEPDALVFCNADGTPMLPNYLTLCWQCVALVTFHALRQTRASALISAGIDPSKISHRLGHNDPTVTFEDLRTSIRKGRHNGCQAPSRLR